MDIRIPDIGDFDKVTVIEVLVAEGDSVAAEDPLITLESDKATLDIPSPAAGRISSLSVAEGDSVGEGDVIGTLEPSEEEADAGAEKGADQESGAGEDGEPDAQDKDSAAGDEAADKAASKSADAQAQDASADEDGPDDEARDDEATPNEHASKGERRGRTSAQPAQAAPQLGDSADPAALPHASPSVRRFARELGVDLTRVEGQGRKGRITREDVQAHVKQAMQGGGSAGAATAGGAGLPPPAQVDYSKYGPVETVPLPRIRKLSAAHLHRSWLHVPHVTQHERADITELEAFRKAENARGGETKLTLLPMLLKACAYLLRRYPDFNSALSADGESLIRRDYVHIGFAADTDKGLVVPVVRDVDRKGIGALAAERAELAAAARAGKLKPQQMQGGGFSVSSLGGIGGDYFTPIVNSPEVAILGVSRAQMAPVWTGEDFAPRLLLPLSLSYDHRVIDGAAAARFVTDLGAVLGDLRRLLL